MVNVHYSNITDGYPNHRSTAKHATTLTVAKQYKSNSSNVGHRPQNTVRGKPTAFPLANLNHRPRAKLPPKFSPNTILYCFSACQCGAEALRGMEILFEAKK